jgi:hypothetical protein
MHIIPTTLAALAVFAAAPIRAQTPNGAAIADATTFGAVATLAPLCGLRDEAWSADLRRAAMQDVTGTQATDDDGLNAAPGNGQAVAALGYGDMEALEDFTTNTPAATCKALRENSHLTRSDAMVARFRQRRDGKPVG